MQSSIRLVVATRDVCGEGALWHPAQNAIFWTDINRRLLHRYVPEREALDTWAFDQPVTAVTSTSDEDLLLVVLGGSIVLWSLRLEKIVRTLFTLPEWPTVRCNDARVAPNGTLWFGTMENNVRADGSTGEVGQWVGCLYSLAANAERHIWMTGFGIANTVAWSPDGTVMYFADTLRNCLYRATFDVERNQIADRVVFSEGFERGLPDGSAVDCDGYLWNCRYGGSCVVRFAPDGSVADVIETPVKNPTTCTFGANDRRTLYITSAGAVRDDDGGIEGALLALAVEIPGLPATPFLL
ncbi:MAG: SMP-30/gluconolactonase/LRE family protein [Edaphobacter sp.]|uniref:SMP-30/gluconolactonase/LRE family protein n=1 Tax=Edaphobacter sp. TaxID=1934404 RepID=UPI00238FC49E|nr:SMP-30/gluconolactonase/LRE family protein [Edaphobacter sp.]MDE1177302.1 SMP-30/gluconolactonase/LRE family protein [Edaphobacter sp.]